MRNIVFHMKTIFLQVKWATIATGWAKRKAESFRGLSEHSLEPCSRKILTTHMPGQSKKAAPNVETHREIGLDP